MSTEHSLVPTQLLANLDRLLSETANLSVWQTSHSAQQVKSQAEIILAAALPCSFAREAASTPKAGPPPGWAEGHAAFAKALAESIKTQIPATPLEGGEHPATAKVGDGLYERIEWPSRPSLIEGEVLVRNADGDFALPKGTAEEFLKGAEWAGAALYRLVPEPPQTQRPDCLVCGRSDYDETGRVHPGLPAAVVCKDCVRNALGNWSEGCGATALETVEDVRG